MAIGMSQGVDASDMAFIVAEGMFAQSCVNEGCGHEFEIVGSTITTVVIPLDTAGLLEILAAVVPESVMPVITRPTTTTAVLLVDRDDEPAIVLLETAGLLPVGPMS